MTPLPSPQQIALLWASEAGDLTVLRQLFDRFAITSSSPELGTFYTQKFGHQLRTEMLCGAIVHKQFDTVRFLLDTIYLPRDDVTLWEFGAIEAAVRSLDVEMVRLLHDHSPAVLQMQHPISSTSCLAIACDVGPDATPIVEYLLDNSDKLDTPTGDPYYNGAVLSAAVHGDQPLCVIKKMVRISGPSLIEGLAMGDAIRRQRIDVLRFLFKNKWYFDRHLGALVDDARQTGNKDIVKLVETQVRRWRNREGAYLRQQQDQWEQQHESDEGGPEKAMHEISQANFWRRFWVIPKMYYGKKDLPKLELI